MQAFRFLMLNLGAWIFWFYFMGYLASILPDKFLSKDFVVSKSGGWLFNF